MPSRFVLNQAGITEYLQHDLGLAEELHKMAEKQLEYAQSIAPVGDPETDKDSGDYKRSFKIEIAHSATRMSVRVTTDDPKKFWIEYGAAHTAKQRVLYRSLQHLRSA